MKAAISGSRGFIGTAVHLLLIDQGFEVISLSRKDLYGNTEALAEKIDGANLLIHLAGAPIIGRWTKKYRREIYHSRIETTRNLVKAMNVSREKPATFICASAVGIYPTDGVFTEARTQIAGNFLGQVCRDWEAEAAKAPAGTRVLNFRFGIVLGNNGGALPKLVLPFRFFAGGKIGSGRQKVSWIHIADLVEIFRFAIGKTELQGPVNITAPETVTNAEFTSTLAKIMNRPAWFPVPAFILRIALGQGAMVLTEGQAAIPEKLLDAGYQFKFPQLKAALEDLLK